MYTNDYNEKITVGMSDYQLSSTDTKTYGEMTNIINPFDLNITQNNPYNDEEKNKSCFLEIQTEFEKKLVVFKTKENPNNFDELFELQYNDGYPDLFGNGTLNISLINNNNELVLMYGTSIIILDINTFEVLKYTSSNNINKYGIKISLENNTYIVKDVEDKITKFDLELKEI